MLDESPPSGAAADAKIDIHERKKGGLYSPPFALTLLKPSQDGGF